MLEELNASSLLRKGAQEWSKDRKSRPIQQEDEYRLHMELNRCLKKDTDLPAMDPDLFKSHGTRTASSRGWCVTGSSLVVMFPGRASFPPI